MKRAAVSINRVRKDRPRPKPPARVYTVPQIRRFLTIAGSSALAAILITALIAQGVRYAQRSIAAADLGCERAARGDPVNCVDFVSVTPSPSIIPVSCHPAEYFEQMDNLARNKAILEACAKRRAWPFG